MGYQQLCLLLVCFFLFNPAFPATINHGFAWNPEQRLGVSPSTQQEQDRITQLPGQPSVAFNQFSGYITVDDTAGRALFYWLTEAETDSASKPLILWFNGGPGCSSLASGAMQEIGPFRIHVNGTGLYMNEYSWNKVANLLFVESPAGVGFSYTNTSSDLHTTGDTRTAEDAHTFLIRWFQRFPQYSQREFFITGESYAGHYVPQLSELVYERNVKGLLKPVINLKGFMVGNPATDFYNDQMGIFKFMWGHALISNELYHQIMKFCDFHSRNVSKKCIESQGYAWGQLLPIDPYNIYAPPCLNKIANGRNVQRTGAINPLWYHIGKGYDPCTENYAEIYFNRRDVQQALHANVTGIPYNWTECSKVLFTGWTDYALSVLPIYEKLIKAGLRIWVYSGDVDAVVPVTSTRYSIGQLNLKIKVDWYPWYLYGQVGGHSQIYEGLTFVTIRNAGHQVPHLQPERAFCLVKQYLSDAMMPNK